MYAPIIILYNAHKPGSFKYTQNNLLNSYVKVFQDTQYYVCRPINPPPQATPANFTPTINKFKLNTHIKKGGSTKVEKSRQVFI